MAASTTKDEPVVEDGCLVCACTLWDNAPWMRATIRRLNTYRSRADR